MSEFATGSIVRTRGREWVVQPESRHPVYELQPLGGASQERTAVHSKLEVITPATFGAPDPKRRGDANACRLLRDAARLATRHAAGPYRCFGRLGFDPRPYQLVPMIMALRLDPVRILIADDVGIGKTIEALLIARELYDRQEISGFSVLCPPHLAPQWAKEMREKFHLDAELVLASTAQRLERRLRSATETIFQRFPITVVSLDFVKSERRRREFLQTCPQLVIVDEAHTCTVGSGIGHSQRQQRFELLKGLAAKAEQHMILTTATPHSGNAAAYESLVGLLDDRFAAGGELAVGGSATDADRDRELARRFVQRRRPDIQKFLGDTKFPERVEADSKYPLGHEMKVLVADTIAFTQKYSEAPGEQHVKRTRNWAMLTLLQAIASSPAATVATLTKRSSHTKSDGVDPNLFSDLLERQLLDDLSDDTDVGETATSVATIEDEIAGAGSAEDSINSKAQKFFKQLRDKALAIGVENDTKYLALEGFLKKHISDKGGTVIFCRFIATAEYLRAELSKALGKKAVVECVVGSLTDTERVSRIAGLVSAASDADVARVLVCTDCLSEGINLQEHFDTVVHYDLSWNPNRHVQREGRVDRFGQPKAQIHVRFFYSDDTCFDTVVLNRLHAKRRIIAAELGYLVSIPISREAILSEIIEEANRRLPVDRTGFLFTEAELKRAQIQRDEDNKECERIVATEKKMRLRFRQSAITPAEVQAELLKVRDAVGSGSVDRFVLATLHRAGCVIEHSTDGRYELSLPSDVLPPVREAIQVSLNPNNRPRAKHLLRFDGQFIENQHSIQRAHPLVEALASYALQSALDPMMTGGEAHQPLAARTGLILTSAVTVRTTIFLLRSRFQLLTARAGSGAEEPLLAEDVFAVAFEGDPSSRANLVRLTSQRANELIEAEPAGNFEPQRAERLLESAVGSLEGLKQLFEEIAFERALDLAVAHDSARNVRKLSGKTRVTPTGDPDILGLFILMPSISNGEKR